VIGPLAFRLLGVFLVILIIAFPRPSTSPSALAPALSCLELVVVARYLSSEDRGWKVDEAQYKGCQERSCFHLDESFNDQSMFR